MAPKYKLVYFALRGRGELIRLCFHVAGVQFVDQRVEFKDWPALKPKTPNGTLPYLCIDDKMFEESMAIARYVARKYNLMGKTDEEQITADIILIFCDEIRNAISRIRNETMLTDAQKSEIQNKVTTELFPKLLGKMEKRLTESKSGYLTGDSITIADLAIVDLVDTPIRTTPNMLDKLPKLSEHRKKIQAHPRIAKYLSTRPDTDI